MMLGSPRKGVPQLHALEGLPHLETPEPEARASEEARCLAWDPFQRSPVDIHFTAVLEINLRLPA